MAKVAFSSHRSIIVSDLRTSATNSGLAIEMAHQEAINSLEFNLNKSHTLLSSSFDQHLKVWDLRKPELPVLIFANHSNPIECCRYNPAYDQLLLFSSKLSPNSASDGGMTLYQAGSASIQPASDLEENEPVDYVVASYEGCLGDVVNQVAWSHGDYWVFAGVSHSASIYCDIVPEREIKRIIL